MSRRITSLGTYVCTLYSTRYVSSHIAYSMVHGATRLINDSSLLHSLLFFPLHSLPPFVSSSFLLYLAPSETRHFIPVPSLLLYLHLSLPLQTCRRCCPASEGIWKLRLYPGNIRHPLTLLRFTSPQHTSLQYTSPKHTTIHFTATHYTTTLVSKRVQCSYQGSLHSTYRLTSYHLTSYYITSYWFSEWDHCVTFMYNYY